MDGTFATVPEQFCQLYIIMGSQRGKLFPASFMLLPNKQGATYGHALDVIKEQVANTPKNVNIDFEQAAVCAVTRKFPQAEIFGCNFHYKQQVFENVRAKKCLPLFNSNENFQVGLDLIYVLCYVPPQDVVHAFDTVISPYFEKHFEAHDVDDDESVEDSQAVASFLCYYERTYKGKPTRTGRSNPYFAISMWNLYDCIIAEKLCTNNGVESWNARWTSTLGTNHNIFRVISAFKNEDSLARQKFHELLSGQDAEANPSRKDRRTCRLNQIKQALLEYSK